jgi:hypothetical protein
MLALFADYPHHRGPDTALVFGLPRQSQPGHRNQPSTCRQGRLKGLARRIETPSRAALALKSDPIPDVCKQRPGDSESYFGPDSPHHHRVGVQPAKEFPGDASRPSKGRAPGGPRQVQELHGDVLQTPKGHARTPARVFAGRLEHAAHSAGLPRLHRCLRRNAVLRHERQLYRLSLHAVSAREQWQARATAALENDQSAVSGATAKARDSDSD